MKLPIEVRLPAMPNYLRPAAGRNLEVSIDVGELDDDGIDLFIEEWARAFREHAESRREGAK